MRVRQIGERSASPSMPPMIASASLPGSTCRGMQSRRIKPSSIVRRPTRALLTSIDDAEIQAIRILDRSGRAVLFPIYQGTYERRP